MLVATGYLFLVSLLGMGFAVPWAIRLGIRWKVLDHPGVRKVHKQSMPVTGGWALFGVLSAVLCGHLVAAFLLRNTPLIDILPADLRPAVNMIPDLAVKLAPIYAGAMTMFIVGLLDDVRGLSVRTRLIPQIAVGLALASLGVRPNLEFLPEWVAILIGTVWIVGVTNAFNFLDGLDGLSTGTALIATTGLMGVLAHSDQVVVMSWMAVLAGIQLGFLRFNYHPARIFLGSSGSLLLGYLLAVSTLMISFMIDHADNWMIPLLTPIFILMIPIYDTASVILIRLIQRRPVAMADQSHFHHRLLRLGFSHLQAVIFIWLVSVAVAVSSVILVDASSSQSILLLLQITALFSLIVIAERVASRSRRTLLDRRQIRALRQNQEDPELPRTGRTAP